MAFSAEQHPILMICTGELCATEGKAYRGIRLALGTVHIFGSTLMRPVKCLHAKPHLERDCWISCTSC